MLGVLSAFPCPALAEGFGPGHVGDDGWLPSAALPTGAGAWEAALGGGYAPGFVPPFRAAERTRTSFGVGGRWMPDRRVQLSLAFDGLWDRTPAGSEVGPGDVRLGAAAWLVDPGPIRLWLGWSAKLPDASDEGELGTDETDITFGTAVEAHHDDFRILGGVGLQILGNPLRFANQDDVPALRLAGSWTPGRLATGVALNADLGTSRNPARITAGAWARGGVPIGVLHGFIELGGGAGLSAAAPDGFVTLGIGFGAKGEAADPRAR